MVLPVQSLRDNTINPTKVGFATEKKKELAQPQTSINTPKTESPKKDNHPIRNGALIGVGVSLIRCIKNIIDYKKSGGTAAIVEKMVFKNGKTNLDSETLETSKKGLCMLVKAVKGIHYAGRTALYAAVGAGIGAIYKYFSNKKDKNK